MGTLQDFSLIKTSVDQYQKEYKLKVSSHAFLHLCLELLLNLQPDEIEESKTEGSADRGIDAIYIDESNSVARIHIFNNKYAKDYDKTKRNFPSNEVDKIINIVDEILGKNPKLKEEVNPRLYEKIKHIWSIFESQNPEFAIYLCSNYQENLTATEQRRFEMAIGKHSYFNYKYYKMDDLANLLAHRGSRKIDGILTVIDDNYFSKIDGDVRALIANVDAEELLKLVTNNFQEQMIEDIFNDNIRLFLRYRSRINKNIKDTATSEDNYQFFYFNNGLTLTCDKFSYQKRRAPIVSLTNVQIVNGGQTVHALCDAYKDKPELVKGINVLVRIYETTGRELSQKIAEYTNSQNPVKNRDIRANDYVQKKLEKELLALNWYYERKKGAYRNKPRERRLDSEKIGQVLMAFYNDLPGDAKNKKRLIFEDKFEDVFNDDLTAEQVLLAYHLYEDVERNKMREQGIISGLADSREIERRGFILHATYYVLYMLKKLASEKDISLTLSSKDKIIKLYPEAIKMVQLFITAEKKRDKAYSHPSFFKGNKLKKIIDDRFMGRPE